MALSSSRQFSSSAVTFGEGTTDVALSQKLTEELKYETDNGAASKDAPEFLKEFQKQGVWKIEDSAGQDEVILTRKFGNENLRLLFTVADIQQDPDEDFEEDTPAENENENEKDESADDEEEVLHTFPIRTVLTLTKNNAPGALNLDMICQEGNFIVENVTFYNDAKVGTGVTAEDDFKRRAVYMGPGFDSLDVGLQEAFEAFLQERGINETVALFIPEYAEWKEQKEYVDWLSNVKKFIDH